jgi:hypothetical protein
MHASSWFTVLEVAQETGISIPLCHNFIRRFWDASCPSKVCVKDFDQRFSICENLQKSNENFFEKFQPEMRRECTDLALKQNGSHLYR